MLRIAASSLFLVLMSLSAAAGNFEPQHRDGAQHRDGHRNDARQFERIADAHFEQLAGRLEKAAHQLRRDTERRTGRRVDRAEARMLSSIRSLDAAAERFQRRVEHTSRHRATDQFAEVRRAYKVAVWTASRTHGQLGLGRGLDRVGAIIGSVDRGYATASLRGSQKRHDERFAFANPVRSGGWR